MALVYFCNFIPVDAQGIISFLQDVL